MDGCLDAHSAIMAFVLENGFAQVEMEIALALQEALANARLHGCKGDATKTIDCRVVLNDSSLVIVIRDPGEGFDPGSVADPLSSEGMQRFSGRGVYLIRQLMDEVAYGANGTELTMRIARRSA